MRLANKSIVEKRYSHGYDLINQDHRQPDTTYHGYDGLGSVHHLADGTGAITDRYTYDAFGIRVGKWNPGAATNNIYLYAGEQYDPDLGLYYNRARYLDTDSGRFWTMDAYKGANAEPLSLHKYLYAHGNPINGIDPSGNFSIFGLLQYLGRFSLNVLRANMVIGGASNALAGLAFGESSLDKIIYNLVTGAALGALSGPITSISKVVASRITSKIGLSLIIRVGGVTFGKAVLETSVTLAKWKLIQGRNPTWGQAFQSLGVNFILSGILESMGTGFDRLGELGKDVRGRLDDIYNTIASGHLPNGFHQMTLEARESA